MRKQVCSNVASQNIRRINDKYERRDTFALIIVNTNYAVAYMSHSMIGFLFLISSLFHPFIFLWVLRQPPTKKITLIATTFMIGLLFTSTAYLELGQDQVLTALSRFNCLSLFFLAYPVLVSILLNVWCGIPRFRLTKKMHQPR